MPRYAYTTVDSQGKPASGKLEAAGPEQARQALAAQGLDAERARLVPIPDEVSRGQRLSADEAAELAGQVAELAKAELPLAPGLRAMAEELPGRRLPQAVRDLSDELEAGVSLPAALDAQRDRFPAHVRGLITAGVRTGRLGEVLQQFVAIRRDRTARGRRVWLSLAYPILLFALLLILFIVLSELLFCELPSLYEEFEVDQPATVQLMTWASKPLKWVCVALVVVLIGGLILLQLLPGVPPCAGSCMPCPCLARYGATWRWPSFHG